MRNLFESIVAYLTVNNIAYTQDDFSTAQPQGQPDQIVYWNYAVLGPEPTQQQMDDAYVIWEGQQIALQNKATASQLLTDTDWTCTVDINNPQYSNPYLGNQDAFLAYRSQVRAIAVNPPIVPVTFPETPQAVWIAV